MSFEHVPPKGRVFKIRDFFGMVLQSIMHVCMG